MIKSFLIICCIRGKIFLLNLEKRFAVEMAKYTLMNTRMYQSVQKTQREVDTYNEDDDSRREYARVYKKCVLLSRQSNAGARK